MGAAVQAGIGAEVDSWLLHHALAVLEEHRQAGGEVMLLVSQSMASLEENQFTTRLREALRQRQLVGTGLVIELGLVEAAGNARLVRERILGLAEMGIQVCLARFGHNENSYKMLRYLGAGYVKVVDRLLGADPDLALTLSKRVHELGARVILPQVDDPAAIAAAWFEAADLLQANVLPAG
jgi:EAL domain-containing protein (putative c-di-GMP-specific phosphodiesterase class I)